MEPPIQRHRNENIFHGGQNGGAPPSIRDLAAQSYAMREHDLRENSVRKQRDDTLYRRSMDPQLTRTRDNRPEAGSLPRYTKEGIVKRESFAAAEEPSEFAKNPTQPPSPTETTKPKPPTMLNKISSSPSSIFTYVLIVVAIVGVALLCTSKWPASANCPPTSEI
jgi:hypothetical protein